VSQVQVIPYPTSCLLLSAGFLSVSASGNTGKTIINWQMTNEENILEYIIERSADGIVFMPLGTLLSQSPGNGINDYRFTDLAPVANGTAYYRIQAVNNAGRAAYSDIVSVRKTVSGAALTISPNPASESASLGFVSVVSGTAAIRLLDMAGHSCWRGQYAVSPGNNVLTIGGLQELRPGLYVLQYNAGSETKYVKLVVRH
jgi:hypothetical protein